MNLIVRNVRMIDGTGADPVPKVNVVVENGRISWIGEGAVSPTNHPHFEDINAEDLTLVPGTFDCHEHFAGDGGQHGVRAMNTDPPEVLLAKAAGNARRALMTLTFSPSADVLLVYAITKCVQALISRDGGTGPR